MMDGKKKRFELQINTQGTADIIDCLESKEKNAICIYNDLGVLPYSSAKAVCDLLNEQEETIQKQNQEITACYDTITTIEILCAVILNHEFNNIENKIDFCHMLNEMDLKDLMFLKECFEAIRNKDLKRITSLTNECK